MFVYYWKMNYSCKYILEGLRKRFADGLHKTGLNSNTISAFFTWCVHKQIFTSMDFNHETLETVFVLALSYFKSVFCLSECCSKTGVTQVTGDVGVRFACNNWGRTMVGIMPEMFKCNHIRYRLTHYNILHQTYIMPQNLNKYKPVSSLRSVCVFAQR